MGNNIENVAVLGGTFDPVHIGHVAMAQRVIESGNFNRLIVVPTGNPPHKVLQNTFNHRFNMACLAFGELVKTEVSDIENRMGNGQVNYSLDVLRALRCELGQARLTLVVGGDSLNELELWHEPKILLEEFNLAIFPRQGTSFTLNELSQKWGDELGKKLFDGLLDAPLLEISSTELRKKLANGENTANFIPEKVCNYIASHQLYHKDK